MTDLPPPGTRRPSVEKRVILFLATLCLANPVILFLLSEKALFAVLVPAICIGLIQLSISIPSGKILSATVFNVIAVASILAHAEVLLIYGLPDRVVDNLYDIRDGYYFNRPLLNQSFRSEEFAVTYRTNSQGFRIGVGQEPSHWVKDIDWLVLGDSFTQGAQVEFEDLYTTRLNVRFPDKIVVNAGISGMGIAHEYRYFIDEGHRYKPSLVILQVGSFNDFMNVEASAAGPVEGMMERSALARVLFHNWRYGDPAELPLGRWTEPFYQHEEDNRDYNIFFREGSARRAGDLESFRKYLTLMKGAVTRAGGTLLVTLLPTREQVSSEAFREVVTRFKIDPALLDMREPNDLMAKLASELGFEFLDLLPAFQRAKDELFFRTDEHLTPAGHGVTAEALTTFIGQAHGTSTSTLMSRELSGDRYPSPSSDGTLLAYQSVRGGTSELFVASSDFSSTRRLTFNGIDESHPMLSRDNERIMFTEGSAESHRTKVVIMNLDGSKRTVVTSGSDEFGAIGTFAPSGLKAAYAGWKHDSLGNLTNPQIVVVNLVTGDKQAVTSPQRESWRPVFAPDGSSIAYISKSDGQFDLYQYDPASGQEQRMTRTPFDEWDPQFSPDGSQLVYAARADGNWDLFLLNVKQRQTVRLTATKGDEWDPSIAPGGNVLFFAGRFGLLEAILRMAVRSAEQRTYESQPTIDSK